MAEAGIICQTLPSLAEVDSTIGATPTNHQGRDGVYRVFLYLQVSGRRHVSGLFDLQYKKKIMYIRHVSRRACVLSGA